MNTPGQSVYTGPLRNSKGQSIQEATKHIAYPPFSELTHAEMAWWADVAKNLQEENEFLKEQNILWEPIHNGDMKIVKMLREHWNEEKVKVSELKEENKALKAEVAKLRSIQEFVNDSDEFDMD